MCKVVLLCPSKNAGVKQVVVCYFIEIQMIINWYPARVLCAVLIKFTINITMDLYEQIRLPDKWHLSRTQIKSYLLLWRNEAVRTLHKQRIDDVDQAA